MIGELHWINGATSTQVEIRHPSSLTVSDINDLEFLLEALIRQLRRRNGITVPVGAKK